MAPTILPLPVHLRPVARTRPPAALAVALLLGLLHPSAAAASGSEAPGRDFATAPSESRPAVGAPRQKAGDEAAASLAGRPRPAVTALRLDGDILLDGALDEPAWESAGAAAGFTQREPDTGEPATERTEVRFAYDDTTLYIGIMAYARDPTAIIASEMRRDGQGGRGPFGAFRDDDSVAVVLDTFHDGRNGFYFETNPTGARADALFQNEGNANYDWDGVWRAAARITDEGWSAEMAIPFSTLRFDAGNATWGLNIKRLIRPKSEEVYWAPLGVDADLFRVSQAGQLRGIRSLTPGLNLRVKPYGIGSTARDFEEPRLSPGEDLDGGIDLLRWGFTDSLTLDATVNTDFAQVEADEQQVNLTRFSLFFPEKREFFLENAGIFDFGTGGGGFRGPPLLKLFFSRRIGLAAPNEDADEQVVPILAGGRLTGRIGEWNVGVLDVQTRGVDAADLEDPDAEGSIPATNWGVARVSRNLGERSSVGMMATSKQVSTGEWNRVLGLDADINPTRRLNFSGFLATSRDSEDPAGWAGGAGFNWRGSIWQASFSAQDIREQFDPEMGFLLRDGIRRYSYRVEYQPRPDIGMGIRNLSFENRADIVTTTEGEVETVDASLRFLGLTFRTGDRITFFGGYGFERLFEEFEIQDGIFIPVGDYHFQDVGVFIDTDGSRPVAYFGFHTYGEFFDGTRLSSRNGVTIRPSRHLSLSTDFDYNDVSLPAGDFSTTLVRQRINVAFSPSLFLNSFAQYNGSDEVFSVNTRFNWIYEPGADLFVVYNEEWDTEDGFDSRNRALILKFTYLFTF